MKKITLLILKMLLIILSASILMLSLRGNNGSPNDSDFSTPSWRSEGPFELSPERGRFALLYSIVEDHSFSFSLPLARFAVPDLGYKNDKYVSLFAPGVSYVAVPGYLLGSWLGASQVGAFSTSSLFALLNAILIYTIAKKAGFSRLASILGGLVFLFATPGYAYATTLYQHHISTFLILSSVYLVIFVNPKISLAVVWFLCALSIPIDYPNIFLMAPIGVYALGNFITIQYGKKYHINIQLTKLLTLIVVIPPLLFYMWFNNLSYGNPFQFSGTVTSVSYIDENGYPATHPQEKLPTILELQSKSIEKKSALSFFEPRDFINGFYTHIFSKDRGIVTYTPVMLLAIIGAISLYQKQRMLTVLAITVSTTTLILYSMWGDPWGGWAFGSRYMIPSYAMLALMISGFLDRIRLSLFSLALFLCLASYSVYVNTAGALSTIAIPPQVQVLSLEQLSNRQERYSWDRSIEYLQNGRSKSFLYNEVLKEYITPIQFFYIVAGSIISLISVLTLMHYIVARKQK